MKVLKSNYHYDSTHYFLNIKTLEVVRVDNPSCINEAEKMVCSYFKIPHDGVMFETIKAIYQDVKSHKKYFTNL